MVTGPHLCQPTRQRMACSRFMVHFLAAKDLVVSHGLSPRPAWIGTARRHRVKRPALPDVCRGGLTRMVVSSIPSVAPIAAGSQVGAMRGQESACPDHVVTSLKALFYPVERVTGVEPALSAWEACQGCVCGSGPTCSTGPSWPGVTLW